MAKKDKSKKEKSPKQMYEQLQKVYSLPAFNVINTDFELSSIETEEQFFLRAVVKRMEERLNFFQDIFSNVLNPDMGSLSVLHESKFFDEKEKERLFVIFQKLMLSQRKCMQAGVCLLDDCCAKTIKDVFQDYALLKEETQRLAKILRETWEKQVGAKEELGYFG